VRVLLVSTYDLGRQPFGLASPAAWLERAGAVVDCVDTSRERLIEERIAAADLVAFYLPMHTATRLAGPLIDRVRRANPGARLAAYGLYAPINEGWLREKGITDVLGPEGEQELVQLAANGSGSRESKASGSNESSAASAGTGRDLTLRPQRAGLLPLAKYAALRLADGSTRIAGSTDATRGCKHMCRHCPIVPVYNGRFHAVPVDAVIADIRQQVGAGAQHISFGDPDFFNGPTHARRIVERLASEFPGVTYDVTIKIEHILKHKSMLPLLARTGCLFVTSAVESIDDTVLRHLRKGHTRADFIAAVDVCRQAGVSLSPTFVPFTPWTTIEGYDELLQTLDDLHLRQQVAPIQLAIRLLITNGSPLLELPDIQAVISEFDAASLTWLWRHPDPRVDALQETVMHDIATKPAAARTTPHMTEAWYCCAEPVSEELRVV
jgi:radical SAM superfamily enzyme YgiQ (UPF0313 family)